MEEIKLRQCNRCHAVYDKPAQAHKKNNIIVQVCPWCACPEFTRVKPRTEAQRKAVQPLRAVDAASALPAEQNPRSNIVPAVEFDTQPRP